MGKGSCRECQWVAGSPGFTFPFFWVMKAPSLPFFCKVPWVFLSPHCLFSRVKLGTSSGLWGAELALEPDTGP